MSKPLGIGIEIGTDRLPHLRCSMPSRTEDAIWAAVEAAIEAGWSVSRFRSEAADAWAQALRDQAKAAAKDWNP